MNKVLVMVCFVGWASMGFLVHDKTGGAKEAVVATAIDTTQITVAQVNQVKLMQVSLKEKNTNQ